MISETRAASGFRSKDIVWADSQLEVIVTGTEESDLAEIEIGGSREIIEVGPAGGLALSITDDIL